MQDNVAAALAVVIYLAALDAADSVVASAVVSVVAHAMALASSRMSRSRMATLRCTLVDRVAVLAVMAVLVLVAGKEEPVLALQAMAAVLELVAGKEVPVSVADAALAVMAVVPELAAAGKAVLVADAVLAAMAAVLAGRELELELVLAPMPGDHRLSSTIP